MAKVVAHDGARAGAGGSGGARSAKLCRFADGCSGATLLATIPSPMHCWGAGDKFQMGDGSSAATNLVPHSVWVKIGSAGVVLGGAFSALLQFGNLVQWGLNLSKVVALYPQTVATNYYSDWVWTGSSPSPTLTAQNIVRAATGSGFVCAVTAGGAAICAGEGPYRELGGLLPGASWGGSYWASCIPGVQNACRNPTAGFQTVTGLGSNVQAVTAGGNHACALTTGGAMHCWGHNGQGQVGFGVLATETDPGTVTGLSAGVAAITAGGAHTCALLATTGVKCWGYNKYGQLGDGSTTNRLTPTPVSGLASGVAGIYAGGSHTCALMTAGGIKCWGYNGTGQLGDGTTADKAVPGDVVGMPGDISSVVAGSSANHTCAVLKDGTLKCWGQNFDGQIGDGAPLTHTPAYVTGFAP